MISEMLMGFVFDSLDKQIIKRVPYALLISLIIYQLFNVKTSLLPLSTISLAIFITSTAIFNSKINKALEGLLIDVEDFKKLVEKLSKIFEGETSLLDDINASENWRIILLGVLSGIFFTLLLTTAFIMIFDYFAMGKELVIPIIIILIVYVYQDMAETNILKEYQTKETEIPFLQDIIETYLIHNSLKSFPTKSLTTVTLKLASRTIGPLCYLSAQKLHSDVILVYNNPEIKSLLKGLTREDRDIYLKHAAGQSMENFFTREECEKITVLQEKSPKENFPYLFDPNYTYSEKDKKKWIALSLNKKKRRKESVLGYMFIHLFRGIFLKRIIKGHRKRRLVKEKVKPQEALLFILIGKRSCLIAEEQRY